MAWSAPTSLGSGVSTNSGTFFTITSVPLTSGVLTILAISTANASAFTGLTVTDSSGNVWTVHSELNPATVNGAVSIAWCVPVATLTPTITVTRTGTGNITSYCFGASSFTGGTSEDGSVLAVQNATSTTITVASGTPSQSGDLFVSALGWMWTTGGTFTEDANYTNQFNLIPATANLTALGTGYIINGTSGSLNYSPSIAPSPRRMAAITVGFTPATSGVTADGAWTEAQDAVSGTATVGNTISADAAWTEPQDAVAGSATLTSPAITASGAWSEQQDVIAGSATVNQPTITVTGSWSESQDSLNGSATSGATDTHDYPFPWPHDEGVERRERQARLRKAQEVAERRLDAEELAKSIREQMFPNSYKPEMENVNADADDEDDQLEWLLLHG